MITEFHVASEYQPLMRILGIDAEAVFEHPQIVCWRKLPDRENCTLDAILPDGSRMRWHIKRFPIPATAEAEARGHRLLIEASIPTAMLVGWGKLRDGRSFVIFDDLAGYKPADKLIESGTVFDSLLPPTADLAARLHAADLHHRDLYLCHFMTKLDGDKAEVRLIDSGRVRRLPVLFTRDRWIVKDLAEFWYSTLKLPVTDEQRLEWLRQYAPSRDAKKIEALRRRVERKVRSIARHDARLHQQRPERDVSIPD